MTPRTRAASRDCLELVEVPAGVHPERLLCDRCGAWEIHTRFRCGGPWMWVCWGCSHVTACTDRES